MDNKPILSLQWHLTTDCEQRCKHCYLYTSSDAKKEIKGEKLMSYEKLVAVADDFYSTCNNLQAIPRVALTGGNPMLHPMFWPFVKYLQNKGIRVSILGNPFGINDEIASRLFEVGIRKFQLSLDGMEQTHDLFRKPGSFLETEKACLALRKKGISVAIMSTVSKINAIDIPALAQYVVSIGANAYAFARHCPTDGNVSESFTPTEYRSFLEKMWEVFERLSRSETKFILKDHLWVLLLHEKGIINLKSTGGVIVDGCGVGISHMTILADGTVYACRRFKSPIGKAPEQSLGDIFMSRQLNEYRDIERLEKCCNCELVYYCRGCMAMAHTTTGRWQAPDPQCWKE